MENKWAKKLAGIATFSLAASGSVAAQTQASIPRLLTQLLGIRIQDPYALVGVAASIGVLWGTTYIVLKLAARKLEIMDALMPDSRGNGSNILRIVSLLVVLSMLGTNSFMTIITSWQSLVGASFGIGLLIMLIYLLIGGIGGGIGGAAWLGGKSTKAAAEGTKEAAQSLQQASQAIGETRDMIGDAEETGNEAEAEEAAEEIESIIQLLQRVLVGDENSLEQDKRELQDAMQKVRDAMGIEEEDEEELAMVAERMKRVDAFLSQAANTVEGLGGLGPDQRDNLLFGQGDFNYDDALRSATGLDNYTQGIEGKYNGGMSPGDFYGLYDVVEDLEKIDNTLRKVAESVEAEESEEGQALKELVDVAEDAVETQETIRELHNELEALEGEDEMLEQLSQEYTWKQLYTEAEEEEDQEAQLENRTQKVEEHLQSLTDQMEEAVSMLQKHLTLDEEVENEIRELMQEDENLVDTFNALISDVEDAVGGIRSPSGGGSINDDIGGRLGAIESHLGALEEEEESEEQREQQVLQELRQAIQEVRG